MVTLSSCQQTILVGLLKKILASLVKGGALAKQKRRTRDRGGSSGLRVRKIPRRQLEFPIARADGRNYGRWRVSLRCKFGCRRAEGGGLLALCVVLTGAALAQPAPTPTPSPPGLVNSPSNPAAPPALVFGLVQLDKEHRALSFPVVVNQRTGVVEYAVVSSAGKTHESIFRTEAQPAHIHVAMLLLGASPAGTNRFPANLAESPPGERVRVEVAWRAGGQIERRAMEELIVAGNQPRPLSAGAWIYNGSHLARRNFVAQRDGSIVSVHIDPDALVNNPRPGRENDDLHAVNTAALPPDGVPVEVIFRLLDPALPPSSATKAKSP